MNYPACFVSWCAMKPEVGSNLLYHACLILSVQKDENSPIQVLDSIGFYGVTPCSDTNPYIRALKKKCGVDIDFSGGYGLLQHEEMRYLNKGEGLTGITFHLSAYRFATLRQSINDDIDQQTAAVKEGTQAVIDDKLCCEIERDQATYELAAKNLPIDDHSINNYIIEKTKQEILPYQIYAKEILRSKKENTTPRLKPFEFKATYSPFTFFTFSDSHTCKNGAVDILERAQIPISWQIQLGIQPTSKSSIPRFSKHANAEELRLFSQGTYSTYQSKSTGLTQKTHNWQPNLKIDHPDKTTLYWSIPPQNIIADHTNGIKSEEFLTSYQINNELRQQMDNLILRSQKIHWLLMQSHTANHHENLNLLIKQLEELIKAFSLPKRNKDQPYINRIFAKGERLLNNIYEAANTHETISLIDETNKLNHHITLQLSETELDKLKETQNLFQTEQERYTKAPWKGLIS